MKESRPSLIVVPSLREAWDDALAPWFKRVLPNAWTRSLPSLVVVPTRGQVNDLRARLISSGQSHLGLQFATPTTLRALLARDDATPPARVEHLRFLLAIAASEIEDSKDESEVLAAKAVTRAPTPLLRALNRLATAGWGFEELGLKAFVPIVQRFNAQLKKCNFELPGELDHRRWRDATKSEPKFSNVLVTGFDGAHWPEWSLLRAAVAFAQEATIVLEEPSISDVDLCWVGSWEEICGEAKRGIAQKPLGESFFTEAEMRGATLPEVRRDFLIGTNFSEQAEAIARQSIRYLAEEKCSRLGIVFAAAGALPRLVASALARHEIPHNDGLAHRIPGVFETAEWQAWIELQRAPRLNSFLQFFNALPETAALSSTVSRGRFEDVLRNAYNEILLDDIDLLRAFCADRQNGDFQGVAETLSELPFLPARATVREFLEQTKRALEFLNWKQRALEIANAARDWPDRIDPEIRQALFLRWLEGTAMSFVSARSATGDNPYARVQLLTVAQAQNQPWSHLIFAGWNEGVWPPLAGAEFAREEEIRAFNRRVQQLNERATRQGSQGEGHTSVRENHSLYLGPAEQRAIALRQFEALRDSATEAVTLSASLVQEDAPERFWNPSECFTELYLKQRREPLTQSALKSLQRTTAVLPKREETRTDVQQTLVAFNARRDASSPASEFDFALRPNGSSRTPPTLSVSDLERMVSAPAIVWMKRYLGAEAPEDTTAPWSAATGKWVHQWLANITETRPDKLFAPFPSAEIIDDRVCASADERCATVQELCDSLDKRVPDWWRSGWLNARYLARHLGGKIATVKEWPWMAAELPIGREGAVKIDNDVELQLRGQIDLILAQAERSDFKGQKIWIVDYKTGATKELKSSDLHDSLVKGTSLQLGLYTLAIRVLGAVELSASIVSFAVKSVAPQLSAADLAPHTDIFADLAMMQRTGIFGMKGEIRPAFGYGTAYPLATLPIDTDILEDKWALTHSALVLEKEEWEIW